MPPLDHALIEANLPLAVSESCSPASVPEAGLRQGMQAVLGGRPAPDGIWLFAYGALLWDGGTEADADVTGSVQGFVRRYAIWDDRNRGRPDCPTLTLGLDRSPGTCAGAAFHIAEAKLPDALWSVWKQEMSGGYYTAEWVDVATPSNSLRAVTFVADPLHRLHADARPDDETAALLARGVGAGGTAAAYLLNTASALRARGVPDPYLERLETKVARLLRR